MKINLFGYNITIDKSSKDTKMPLDLQEAIAVIEKYGAKAGSTAKQKESAKNATKLRSDKAKSKIMDAILEIKANDIKLTMSFVSKISGCSINTVRKYKDLIQAHK